MSRNGQCRLMFAEMWAPKDVFRFCRDKSNAHPTRGTAVSRAANYGALDQIQNRLIMALLIKTVRFMFASIKDAKYSSKSNFEIIMALLIRSLYVRLIKDAKMSRDTTNYGALDRKTSVIYSIIYTYLL